MSEHSKLPFSIFNQNKVIQINDAEGNAVCHWMGFDSADQSHKEKLANAELIVTACNAHYELLEACENSLREFQMINGGGLWKGHPFTQAVAELKSAINKAKGKP